MASMASVGSAGSMASMAWMAVTPPPGMEPTEEEQARLTHGEMQGRYRGDIGET